MKKQNKNSKKTAKGFLSYHIAASLVSLAPRPHTWRSMHHRHTSHGVLLIALLLTGVLLFSNLGALSAYGLTSSGSRTITVNIAGAPPSIGANITFPTNNTITKSSQIQVVGTCAASTLVATYNNGSFAGSSMCTSGGDYTTTIQLQVGVNILQSQDYDGLNQPGPVTAQVQITREQDPAPITTTTPAQTPTITTTRPPTIATVPADIVPDPTPPIVDPAPQPADNPCFESSKKDALALATPTIITNCINRSISAGEMITLPIRVTGGAAPFALTIDWGDGITESKSVLDTEYHNYDHTYAAAGIIRVGLKTTDSNGSTAFLQTVVQINGTPVASATGSPSAFATITANLGSIWTEAPVPLYWAAVTLVLGFWFGDIFQRVFTKGSYATKRPRAPVNRHRHA